MRSLSVLAALSLAFVLSLPAASASAETFDTNLTVGSKGPDVATLQQFLVSKGYLQMPPGVPFGYFGPLTKGALARWQAANGIAPAVGYFGPISRQAIVPQIGTAITTPDSSAPMDPTPSPSVPTPANLFSSIETDTPSAPGMKANQLMLFRATPFEIRPGDLVTLDGSGFSKTLNKVYFSGSSPVTAISTDGAILKALVPAGLVEGEYKLSVSNVLGSSENPGVDVVVKVTNNPEPPPVIESASITGDTVTLIGKGFTSSNKLFTTLGDSSGPVSSNGTTLTFRVVDLSRYSQVRQFTLGKYQAALWIYVQNEHGINKDPYKLEIII